MSSSSFRLWYFTRKKTTPKIFTKTLKNWLVHNKPSVYMDRDVCKKSTIHLKIAYGENKLNPKVLLYGGHDSHFEDRVIHILHYHHIKPFIPTTGDSGNYQQNDNGKKIQLKGIYWQKRINWQRQHGNLIFKNSRINSVLVETWRYFQLHSSPVIINDLNKTKHVPISLPDEGTSTQAYIVASQTPKGGNGGIVI